MIRTSHPRQLEGMSSTPRPIGNQSATNRRATATDPDKMTAAPSRQLEGMSNRHGCRYGGQHRTPSEPTDTPTDPDRMTGNRPDMRKTAPRPDDNQPTQRRATMKATSRPDMIRTTPRQPPTTGEHEQHPRHPDRLTTKSNGNQSATNRRPALIYIIRYKDTATDNRQ